MGLEQQLLYHPLGASSAPLTIAGSFHQSPPTATPRLTPRASVHSNPCSQPRHPARREGASILLCAFPLRLRTVVSDQLGSRSSGPLSLPQICPPDLNSGSRQHCHEAAVQLSRHECSLDSTFIPTQRITSHACLLCDKYPLRTIFPEIPSDLV